MSARYSFDAKLLDKKMKEKSGTRKAFAEEAGVNIRTIEDLLKRGSGTQTTLEKIANALEMSFNQLFFVNKKNSLSHATEKFRIREAMKSLNISGTELAKKINKPYRSVDEFVRRGSGDTKTFEIIARALGITLDEAYYGIDHSKQQPAATEQQPASGEQKIINTLEEIAGINGKMDTKIGAEALCLLAYVFMVNGYKEQADECLLKVAKMEMDKTVAEVMQR